MDSLELLWAAVNAAREYRESELEYASEYKRVGKERSAARKRGEYVNRRDSWKPYADRINIRRRKAKEELDRLLEQLKRD